MRIKMRFSRSKRKDKKIIKNYERKYDEITTICFAIIEKFFNKEYKNLNVSEQTEFRKSIFNELEKKSIKRLKCLSTLLK